MSLCVKGKFSKVKLFHSKKCCLKRKNARFGSTNQKFSGNLTHRFDWWTEPTFLIGYWILWTVCRVSLQIVHPTLFVFDYSSTLSTLVLQFWEMIPPDFWKMFELLMESPNGILPPTSVSTICILTIQLTGKKLGQKKQCWKMPWRNCNCIFPELCLVEKFSAKELPRCYYAVFLQRSCCFFQYRPVWLQYREW